MTPHEFLKKWRNAELKERSASQSHFIDLCALLDLDDPVSSDPKGEWFTFEKGATKTNGGNGWADVWRRGCFGWEYKGKHANLEKAYSQLLQYSVALENPPLLIVSDMVRIIIRTNWTNSVQETHEISIEDLVDGSVRDRLKAAFTKPELFMPLKSRQDLTEETAREFVGIAQRLRDRGHDAHEVAHFCKSAGLLHVRRGRRATTGESLHKDAGGKPKKPSELFGPRGNAFWRYGSPRWYCWFYRNRLV